MYTYVFVLKVKATWEIWRYFMTKRVFNCGFLNFSKCIAWVGLLKADNVINVMYGLPADDYWSVACLFPWYNLTR